MAKTQKEGKQHKRLKKRGKKEKEDRTNLKAPKHNDTKAKGGKKQAERTKNCAKRGHAVPPKPALTNSAKLEIGEIGEKNYQNKQTT